MKKILIIILAMFLSAVSFAQTSSGTWNSATATYSNSKHNLSWNLIEGITWARQPVSAQNTLFKAQNDETHILVVLGASPDDSKDDDIWKAIPQYESNIFQKLKELEKAEAKRNGMTFNGMTIVKSQLCGIHANKIKSDMTKYDSEYKTTIHSVKYSYHLCKNGYRYFVSVAILSVLEEELGDFGRIATMLFNGFSIK